MASFVSSFSNYYSCKLLNYIFIPVIGKLWPSYLFFVVVVVSNVLLILTIRQMAVLLSDSCLPALVPTY